MMRPYQFKKLARHYKRLNGLPIGRKLYYISQVLFGERLGRRGAMLWGPRLIEFTLTHRCQCRCVHCYSETDDRVPREEELTTAEVISVMKQAVEIGCTEVSFTGGEPLLREDLLELIGAARKLHLVSKINTNGIRLDRDRVADLKKAGLGWCSVSIDSSRPERHDELRRYPGCFERAVEGLKELRRQGVPASITTYTPRKIIQNGDLREIIGLGHKLDVETVRVLFPVPMGNYREALDEVLSLREREMVREYLSDPIVTMESPNEKTRCLAAASKLNILPAGEVTPCVFIPAPYGNVRKENLKSIWKRMSEFDRTCKPSGKCALCDEKFREKFLAEKSPARRD
jgi:MoaA/NifB/PqqE/SkfB family radical SAM enzyme